MNLLYLTIVIPLLSFLILVCSGRHISKNNIIIIGISTIILLCILTVLVCIDYQANTVPDTSLIYTRYLWEWFTVGDTKIAIALQLDGLSLVFLVIIAFFSLLIYSFSACYLTSSKDIYTFFAYGNLLIASLLLLILADNLFILLVGWEGMGISCYLLIGIYYQKRQVSFSAIKAFIVISIADAFLLLGMFLIHNELNTLNIREIISLANENLAIDSEIIFWITLVLFISVMGKAGLFPLHTSFTESSIAPMPVVTILQSLAFVLSSGYFVLRLSPLFMMSTDVFVIMGVMAGITLIFASCVSLVQNNIKTLVTYINLGQISYIFFAFVIKNWELALYYMISYSVTSALLLLSSAILIKVSNGEQNIYKLGGLCRRYPVLYGTFLLSAASLCAMPWIMSAFYTKGDIIWGLMINDKMGLGTIALIGILLSTLSILRLISTVFHHKQKLTSFTPILPYSYLPLAILAIMSTATFVYLPLPIQGLVPSVDFNTQNQLILQLLLAAVTILSILIAYILFFDTNSEINEIIHTPIGKMLFRLWHNEWCFDQILQIVVIRPYLYLARLIKTDPLSQWNRAINWGARKINFQIASLENSRLRWYMMSIVIGSIIILLLLILI
ncbi:NADH dehydrogenase subunit L [Orbus hercynius]|uniref:NADH dehydrogenase subunit L n=1 Tax=Orbus hercynius TaxID=593135 RepID=A0A495RFS3_9GAMM|nr:proton-conducting transporter membrane subunit [Orbus hercynius]RKS85738.1 NADH dehydrogenase subunit L [Orbus hercynius]